MMVFHHITVGYRNESLTDFRSLRASAPIRDEVRPTSLICDGVMVEDEYSTCETNACLLIGTCGGMSGQIAEGKIRAVVSNNQTCPLALSLRGQPKANYSGWLNYASPSVDDLRGKCEGIRISVVLNI
jgi:hypothetical protein